MRVHYRSLSIFALMACGLWALGAALILAAAVVPPDQQTLLRAGIVVLAIGLLEGGSAWLLALGDAIHTMRWPAMFGLIVAGAVFAAIVGLETTASPALPGYGAYVVSLILAILLLPMTVLVYCDVVEGPPFRRDPVPGRPALARAPERDTAGETPAPAAAPQSPVAPVASVASPSPVAAAASASSVAVGPWHLDAVEQLRRSSSWAHLGDDQRQKLLDRYPTVLGPAISASPLLIDHTSAEEAQTEDWLARCVVERFQPEAASVVWRWLQDASPNAHLLISGPAGYGRTSLVASLARRMGKTPVIVAALDHPEVDIKSALRAANAGVLVVSAAHLVARGEGNLDWIQLVQALRTGARQQTYQELRDSQESREPAANQRMPERGVPCAVRVAVVGTVSDLQILQRATNEFPRLFRYHAAFNTFVTWTPDNEAVYGALADGIAVRYRLCPMDPIAVARLVEEGARRAGGLNQFRLTANLLVLHDLAVEAGMHAISRGAASTSQSDVEEIIARRRWEHGAVGRQLQERILSGTAIVPTAGAAVGQINGLSVRDADPGEGSYGVPFRISAITGPGSQDRLVDVEREADAADKDHIMGALTMVGYLTRRYGQKHPISAVTRIRFEERFAGGGTAVGGPSASAAELFALLSALAEAPIYSSLAVTGVVGQYGEIQAIGGVNHKIEGFWEICRKRWMAGERPLGPYGVLIPAANARDLMLRPEVAASIAAGQFHVWAITTVDEGLPILTSLPAAAIHRRVEQRLGRFYRVAVKGR